ncbi:MAG: AmmeMemoRadiSam system protein A [Chloroflexota bacterium]
MSTSLTDGEKQILLRIAREAIENAVRGRPSPRWESETLTPALLEDGASFVTLTIHNELRGCIGALEAHQPLVEDVREHAVAAALGDPRFLPVRESELDRIHIEVSRLTPPHELQYSNSKDLLVMLRPHVDGVILKHGFRRATFLPQVWEKIPDPEEFLQQLCYKMGERINLWRDTKLQVYTYQVEEFHELN